MLAKLIFISSICISTSYTIAILGGHGALGRELAVQSLEKKWNTLSVVRRDDPVFEPFRGGWLYDESLENKEIQDDNHYILNYEDIFRNDYDALIIAVSGKPFEDNDMSVIKRVLDNISTKCTKICLISAHGVGDSIRKSNLGIKMMKNWYLKSTYQAKTDLEKYVNEKKDRCEISILRPKVLSYGKIPMNPEATPRQILAENILTWIETS